MPKAPDLEELARRYLDLWQDQMAAVAADPMVAEALANAIAFASRVVTGAPAGVLMPDAIPKGLMRGRPAPRLGPRPSGCIWPTSCRSC